jgi:hypothetical protein
MEKLIRVFVLMLFMCFSSLYSFSQLDLTLYEGNNFTGEFVTVTTSNRGNGVEMSLEGRTLNNKLSSIKFGNRRDYYLQLYDEADNTSPFKILYEDCTDLSQLGLNNKVSMIKFVYALQGQTLAFVNRNDPVAMHVFYVNPDGAGYRLYGATDNKLNYFRVEEGYAAILWENADDAHDRLNKGFGEVFVISGQGKGANSPKQAVGPKIRNKVSYIKIVPADKLLESL